jgi:16S rRNA G966 N2-methylase RsmD
VAKNPLYYGDNLDVLRRHVAAESVDLVYLDPPFNSQRECNVLFQERNGSRSASRTRVFGTHTLGEASAVVAEQLRRTGEGRRC